MTTQRYREADFLNAVLENAGALVVVLDHEGRIRRFNRACEKLSGYTFAEVEGKFPWDTFLPPEDAAVIRRHAFEALARKPQAAGGKYTNYWVSKTGQRHLTQWSNTLLRDADGEMEFMVCVGADVTDRRQVEQQLRLKDAAIEHALNAIAMSDPDGRLSYVNPAFVKMWGYASAEEVLGRPATDFWAHPEQAGAVIDALYRHDRWTGVLEGRRADGRSFTAELMAVLIRDGAGHPLHILASFLDITERQRAEQTLRTSEQRLRYAEQMTHVGTWERDLVTDEGWWSDEQYQLLGITRSNEPLPRDSFLELVHPDDRETIRKAYAELFAKRTFEGDFRIVRPSGEVRHIHAVAMASFDDTGRPVRLIGANLDITERKRVEAVLRRNEAWLRHTQAIANVGSWELDLTTDALKWSEETCRMFGRDPARYGSNYTMFLDAVHPAERDAVDRAYQTAVANGTPLDITHRIVLPDGSTKWVQERGETVYDEHGKALRTTGAVQDITERKRYETQLSEALEIARRSERELKALNESLEARVLERTAEVRRQVELNKTYLTTTLDGFFAVDTTGRIRDANPAFRAMLGYTEAELLRMSVSDIEANETPQDVGAHIEKVLNYGHDRFDTRHRRKDGGVIEVEITVSLIEIDGEKLFYAFAHDITRRKRAEAALIRARDEAERANQAKSEFLSRMSHELRTPMNAILGFAQVLEGEAISVEQLDFVHEIHRAGDHLLELINELLDLSRIESGKLAVVVQVVPVEPAVNVAVQFIQPLLARKNVTLRNRCHAEGAVMADPTRLRQILLNLLSNAVKYNRDGGRIEVDCRAVDADRLRLCVTDTGPGIAPEKLDRLFKPFERLGAEFGNVEGTGIGLALARQLAGLMGGTMGVDSTLGQGSTFWIELPRAQALTQTADQSVPSAAQTQGRHTVLYVEDNAANLRVIEAVFRRSANINLVSATNGEYGLELARRYRPEAILLDIHLPGIDGYAVLDALSSDPATRDIPVLALSADAMPLDIERGLRAGFRHYLTKPVRVDELRAALDDVLTRAAE